MLYTSMLFISATLWFLKGFQSDRFALLNPYNTLLKLWRKYELNVPPEDEVRLQNQKKLYREPGVPLQDKYKEEGKRNGSTHTHSLLATV